jgi:hypothetical protein
LISTGALLLASFSLIEAWYIAPYTKFLSKFTIKQKSDNKSLVVGKVFSHLAMFGDGVLK